MQASLNRALRAAFRDTGAVIAGHKPSLRAAMEGAGFSHEAAELVAGNDLLLVTGLPPGDVSRLVDALSEQFLPPVGEVVPEDVWIPEGAAVNPARSGFCAALGVATKIARGEMVVVARTVVVPAGQIVTRHARELLDQFGLKPCTRRVLIRHAIIDGDPCPLEPAMLSPRQLVQLVEGAVTRGVLDVLSVSMLAGFPQKSGSTSTMTSGVLYTAADDTSGACAYLTGSTIVLSNVNVTTIGGTSSEDSSSFYGLNAGVLAAKGGVVKMVNVSILTTGKGANGAFAYNGTLTMANSTIVCYGSLGHGVDSTYGGYIRIDNVDITTYGAHGAPLSNDRGGGTVIAYGGTMKASGQGSPGIYSTGTIETHGCSISATNTEAITIEGRNKAHLYDGTYISGVCQGVKIYCSTSGDATAGRSSLIIKDSTLELTSASSSVCLSDTKSLIYVDGTNDEEAEITLENATLVSAFSTLLWAIKGANVLLTAVSQTLSGNALASSTSTAVLYFNTSSTLNGRSRGVSIVIDSTSTWNVTGQSWATALTTAGTIKLSKTAATITVSGTATLGGALVLPSTFTEGTSSVITATSLSGQFSSVTINSTSRTVSVTYTSTSVTVTVTGSATGTETADTDSLTISDTLWMSL
eukprot:m51a1_g4542 hypothetical protein (639) ;mRNA; r:49374-52042